MLVTSSKKIFSSLNLVDDVCPLLHLGDALLQPGEGDVQGGQPRLHHAAQLRVQPNQVIWAVRRMSLKRPE